MRPILLISLAAFYLVMNCGAVVNIHFCCGELVDWSLNGEASKCCDHSATGIQKNCCKDVSLVFQQDDTQETSKSFKVILPVLIAIPLALPEEELTISHTHYEKRVWAKCDPPPFAVQSDLYLSNRVIRL